VCKVKAHVAKHLKEQMAAHELYHIHGNEVADFYARSGADFDSGFGKHQAMEEWSTQVKAAGIMIGKAQAHLRDSDLQDSENIVIKGKSAQPMLRVGSASPCDVRRLRANIKGKDQWRCTRCRRSTRSKRVVGTMQMQQCPGSVRARLMPHETHKIIDTGVHLYCRICGVYGVDKGFNLRARCRGAFANSATKTGGQLSRLRRGRHPVSGAKL